MKKDSDFICFLTAGCLCLLPACRTTSRQAVQKRQETDSARGTFIDSLFHQSRFHRTGQRTLRLQQLLFSPPDTAGRQFIRQATTVRLDEQEESLREDSLSRQTAVQASRHLIKKDEQNEEIHSKPFLSAWLWRLLAWLFPVCMGVIWCFWRKNKSR